MSALDQKLTYAAPLGLSAKCHLLTSVELDTAFVDRAGL